MSTRGIVGIAHDGGFTGRYVHSDAYPSWTGPQLQKLYREHGSAQALIDYLLKPGEAGIWDSGVGNRWLEHKDYRELIRNDEDCGAEWAWLLSEDGIDVVAAMRATGEKAQGMFGGIGDIVWEHVGRVGWQDTDVDWKRIECGEHLERCIHYAEVHFPEAKDSRLSTDVWLARTAPGSHDITELIVNRTGKRIKLNGCGSRGSAQSHHYNPYSQVAYWWCGIEGSSRNDIRVYRCLKGGRYKLEKDYTGVVVTAAGEQLVAPGTVLDR